MLIKKKSDETYASAGSYYKTKQQRAISLLEVVLVTSIVALIAALTIPTYINYKQNISIREERRDILSYLKNTRGKAMAGENFKEWGVHFVNQLSGDDFFEIYYTDSDYSHGTVTKKVWISPYLKFINPAEGASKNIQFQKINGDVENPGSVVIALKNNDMPQTISINKEGGITY